MDPFVHKLRRHLRAWLHRSRSGNHNSHSTLLHLNHFSLNFMKFQSNYQIELHARSSRSLCWIVQVRCFSCGEFPIKMFEEQRMASTELYIAIPMFLRMLPGLKTVAAFVWWEKWKASMKEAIIFTDTCSSWDACGIATFSRSKVFPSGAIARGSSSMLCFAFHRDLWKQI